MGFFTGYYIGKQISKSIKEEQQRQKIYQDSREWNENYEKQKAKEERNRRREEEERRKNIRISSTERAKKAYSELRDEIKKRMNYDEKGFIQAYVDCQLEVSSRSDRIIDASQAIWYYNESLGWFAAELQEKDIRNAVKLEYDNLKPSLKKQIPKDLFVEEYVRRLSVSLENDPTGKYQYGITCEGDTIEVIENVKEEIKSNPYTDYEIGNTTEYENDTDKLTELERWFSLYEKGAITSEEYEQIKNNILNNNIDNPDENDISEEVEKKQDNLIYSFCTKCGAKYESTSESPSKCFFCGGEISNELETLINNELDFNKMNFSEDIDEEDMEYIRNQWKEIKNLIFAENFIEKFNQAKEEYKDATFLNDKDFVDMVVNGVRPSM